MPAGDPQDLPANWTEAELKSTVQSSFGIGSDNDLPPETRFVKNVAQLVRRRLARHGEDASAVAVFFMSPSAPEPVAGNSQRVPMLDNALTQLSGYFWFVSEVVASGLKHPIAETLDDQGIFDFATTTLELGSTPAIIADFRTDPPTVRLYSAGLSSPDNFEVVSITSTNITFIEIFASLDRTYKDGLSSPNVQGKGGKLWRNAKKNYPISDAEQKIQFALKIGLANAFPTCTIREEQGMPVGRLDLEIEEADPLDRTKITRHAILELKVLRSFYATGKAIPESTTKTWVKDGVVQAAEYKRDRGAMAAALCCFDMRKDDSKDTCFKHVATMAKDSEVLLRRWMLFTDAKSYRTSIAA